jgi:hypothetical protein
MNTYTIATRPNGSTFQFVPISGFWSSEPRLMSLADAQVVAREYRASGEIEAVAFNTVGV